MAKKRSCNWSFLLYEDSAPSDWYEKLKALCINIAISPLHTPADDDAFDERKPHRHIDLFFDSLKSFEQVKEITDSFNSPIPIVINSKRAHLRYLIHLDDPEKQQFKPEDVFIIGDIDYLLEISSSSDKYKNIKEMIYFVELNNINYFNVLLNYCSENNEEWFRTLCDNGTYVIREYIKSRTYQIKESNQNL